MDLAPAGVNAELDRFIGYWQEYSTSHEAYDTDWALHGKIRNSAPTLAEEAHANHEGRLLQAGRDLTPRRQK